MLIERELQNIGLPDVTRLIKTAIKTILDIGNIVKSKKKLYNYEINSHIRIKMFESVPRKRSFTTKQQLVMVMHTDNKKSPTFSHQLYDIISLCHIKTR